MKFSSHSTQYEVIKSKRNQSGKRHKKDPSQPILTSLNPRHEL
jgi:hypothetical protein